MRLNLYQQQINTVVVDGVPLSGFYEGDWMEIKVDGNAAERTKGGDGPSMNLSTKQGGQITINLVPTSPVLGDLYAIRNLQAVNPTLFGIVLYTGVQELITAAGCAFGDLPQFTTGGPKQAGRKFVFECLQILMDTSSVESILGSVAASLF
jgi:hypothetical protein